MNDQIVLERTRFLIKQPNDFDSEQKILGQLIYAGSNGNKELDKIMNVIDNISSASNFGEHFYNFIHEKIYTLIYYQYSKQRLVSPGTLASVLYKEQYFQNDIYATESYLDNLVRNASLPGQIEEHIKSLIDLSTKRQLIEISSWITSTVDNDMNINSSFEFIGEIEKKLANLAIYNNHSRDSRSIDTIGSLVLNQIEYNRHNKTDLAGITTGYKQLDRMLGGFQNSDLIIAAARPAMGKTSFALSLALNIAEHIRDMQAKNNSENHYNKLGAIGFVSLEMSGEQLVSRLISMKSGVNSMKLRSGNLNNEEFEKVGIATNNLRTLDFIIDDSAAISMTELRSKVRRMAIKNRLKVLFVDYLQLLHGSKKSSDSNRVNEISEISRGLKEIAKELNIPVIALAQLSREVEKREDKIPRLSDLRESGSIEQDADIVMFIHREEYYLRKKEPKKSLETNYSHQKNNSELVIPIGEKELKIFVEGNERNKYKDDEEDGKNYEDLHDEWKVEMDSVLNKAEIIISKHRNGPVGTVSLCFDHNTTAFVDPEKYDSDDLYG